MHEKKCFVVSSIGEEESKTREINDEKFNHIFKPVLEELGYRIDRSDKINVPGLISEEIVNRILSDDLVLVDVSDENPNVFYELSVRNAISKPVILIKEKNQILPFDTYDKRAISIDLTSLSRAEKSKENLKKFVISSEKNPTASSKSILSNCIKCEQIKSDKDIQNIDLEQETTLKTMQKFGKDFPKYDFIIIILYYKENILKSQLISILNNFGDKWDNYIHKKMYKKNNLFFVTKKKNEIQYHLTKEGKKYAQEIMGRVIVCKKKADH